MSGDTSCGLIEILLDLIKYISGETLKLIRALNFLPLLCQVIFEAVRGFTFNSDIAIDDVSFSTECYPSEGKSFNLFESE